MMSASVNFCPTITTLLFPPPQAAVSIRGIASRAIRVRRTSGCMSPPSVSRRGALRVSGELAPLPVALAATTLATPRGEWVDDSSQDRERELEHQRHRSDDQRSRDDLGGLEALVAVHDDPA